MSPSLRGHWNWALPYLIPLRSFHMTVLCYVLVASTGIRVACGSVLGHCSFDEEGQPSVLRAYTGSYLLFCSAYQAPTHRYSVQPSACARMWAGGEREAKVTLSDVEEAADGGAWKATMWQRLETGL